MARLAINPDPLRVVGAEERAVWSRQPGWRCDHEDGRGRCARRDTKALVLTRDPLVIGHYCPSHYDRHDVLCDA